MDETSVVCRCCGEPERVCNFDAPCWRDGTSYPVFECGSCHSLNLDTLENADRYYTSDYDSMLTPTRGSGLFRMARRLSGSTIRQAIQHPQLARSISRPEWAIWFRGLGLGASSRILDFGSGAGGTLAWLSSFGFRRLVGYDPFLSTTDIIDSRYRVYSEIEAVRTDTPSFDVVLLSHVLEHVDSPVDLLCTVKTLLAPEGSVVVIVPLGEGAFWNRFRESVKCLDPPVHRFLPTEVGLAEIAMRTGMTISSIRRTGMPHMEIASEAIRQTGLNDLKFKSLMPKSDRAMLTRWAAAIPRSERPIAIATMRPNK